MSKKIVFIIIGLIILNFAAFRLISSEMEEKTLINNILDRFHRAASEVNEKEYMGYIADDGYYLGTDPDELWTKEQFAQYVKKYFSKGKGWTYIPKERNLHISKKGDIAWFFERLFNEQYGQLRGSGILIKVNGKWKIIQYNMVFTIPNKDTKKIVEIIKKKK